MTLIDKIKSPKTVIYGLLVLILIVQSPHNIVTFDSISRLGSYQLGDLTIDFGSLHGMVFSFALEIVIAYFALHKKELVTGIFMVVSFIVTLYYYFPEIEYLKTIVKILLSLSVPLMIFFISRNLNARTPDEIKKEKVREMIRDNSTYDQIRENLKVSNNYISTVKEEMGLKVLPVRS